MVNQPGTNQLYGQATPLNYPQVNVLNGQQNMNFSKPQAPTQQNLYGDYGTY